MPDSQPNQPADPALTCPQRRPATSVTQPSNTSAGCGATPRPLVTIPCVTPTDNHSTRLVVDHAPRLTTHPAATNRPKRPTWPPRSSSAPLVPHEPRHLLDQLVGNRPTEPPSTIESPGHDADSTERRFAGGHPSADVISAIDSRSRGDQPSGHDSSVMTRARPLP